MERARFLTEECGDDEPLRREAEELLAELESGDSPLDTGAIEQAVVAGAADLLDEAEHEILPSSIGDFRIVRPLGRGGMGQVYLADQTAPVRRRVALKIIRLGLDAPDAVSRFRLESQALAVMDHPNISRVFGAGTTRSGRPFFVMEFIDGPSIIDYCDQHRLGVAERLRLFTQVCRGVQHAHRNGIIHRDLKPANVLVTEIDGRPVPKVIDFGISKAFSEDLESSFQTQIGQFMGTPEFMSPEQTVPGADIDTRTDVYSLGALLYRLLVGKAPFDMTALRGSTFAEVQRILSEQEPIRPSRRVATLAAEAEEVAARRASDPATLTRLLARELDWIILRAMDKDRERRYESPLGLAQDVERYLADQPVLASPPDRRYRVRKFVRRHRLSLALGGAVVFGLLGASIGLTVALLESRQKQIQIAAARDEADAVTGFLEDMLVAVDPEEQGKDVTVREVLDVASGQIEAEFPDNPLLRARLRNTIGNAYYKLTDYDEARPHLEWALATRRELLGGTADPTVSTTEDLGNLHLALSNLAEAESLLTIAYKARRRAGGDDDPATMGALADLASVYLDQGRNDEAVSRLLVVAEYWDRTKGPEDVETLRTLNALANAYAYQGDSEKAQPIYMRILAAQQRTLGEKHPLTLSTINNLALNHYDLGNYAETESLLVLGLSGRREVFGEEHAEAIEAAINLGGFLAARGRIAEAIPVLEKGLRDSRKVNGEDQIVTLYIMNTLGNAYASLGDLERAASLHEETHAIRSRVLGDEHRDALSSLANLADVRRRQGRTDEAEGLIREVLARRRAVLGDSHPHTLLSLHQLGSLLLERDDLAEASLLLEEALAGRRAEFGEDHPSTIASGLTLAELRARQDRWEECEALLLPVANALSQQDDPWAEDRDRVIGLAVRLGEATGRSDLPDHLRDQLAEPGIAGEEP